MNQVVCLSTSPWHPIPTRKQQVMGRLPDAESLYFDPPVTTIAKYKDPAAKEKAQAFRAPGEVIRPGLTVYAIVNKLVELNEIKDSIYGEKDTNTA